MKSKSRTTLKLLAILLAIIAVLLHLDILVMPALALYRFWILTLAFGILLLGSR